MGVTISPCLLKHIIQVYFIYLFIYLFNVDPLSCLYFIQTSVLQTPVRTAEAALIRQMASSAHASCGTLGTTVAQNVIGFLFYWYIAQKLSVPPWHYSDKRFLARILNE